MKIENYFLDLNTLGKLPEKDQEMIHSYYRDMCYSYHDGRVEMARSFMLTLVKSGYLLNERDEKINTILDE